MKNIGQNTSHVESIDAIVRRIVRDEVARIRPTGATAIYSQHDHERPAGTKRQRYLDVHALAFGAGDVGATKIGRARLLTPDAWARWSTSLPSRKKAPPPTPVSLDDQVAAELGVERGPS
jgi:hypothetical protein